MADSSKDTGWRDTRPCWAALPPRRSRGTTSLVGLARHVPGGHLGAGPEPQAEPDPLQVRLGRPFADAEALGQLAVGEAVGHQRRHLGLAWREAGRHGPPESRQPEEASYLLDHGLRVPHGRE